MHNDLSSIWQGVWSSGLGIAVTVDVIEEVAPGVLAITEFEETEVRGEGPEQPEETPPEPEER
jgi:hypothetical protein